MRQSIRYRGAMAAFGVFCGLAVLTAGAAGRAATSEVIDRSALRVCADPANLPFSNRAGEGFKNKIAELLAAELGVPVQYTWFPQAIGFVRNTLKARKCDLVIGISLGFELLQNTNPYYRSAYSLVYRPDGALAIEALDDPVLKDLTIGVVAGTPPASAIAKHGLLANVRPYQLMVDTRFDSPGKQMVEHIAAGAVDVGVLWGPIAGYYAQQQEPPPKVVPLATRPGESRMDFRITMGIRFNEPDWKHRLNDLIAEKQDEIDAILLDYGVPLLDEQGKVMPPVERKAEAARPPVPEPDGYRMQAYRAPVPGTLKGATVDTTDSLKALIDGGDAVLVDVLPRPPRAGGPARRRHLAPEAAPQHPRHGLAAEHRLRGALGRGGALLPEQPGAPDRRRQKPPAGDLLPGRLLDVVERGQARAFLRLQRRALVPGRHRRLDRRRPARRAERTGAAGRHALSSRPSERHGKRCIAVPSDVGLAVGSPCSPDRSSLGTGPFFSGSFGAPVKGA